MARHELKIWPEFFDQIRRGKKTAELRVDDRGYMAGDILILKEWKRMKRRYTGREIEVQVVGITRLSRFYALENDVVMLSFVPRSSVGCRFVMPEEFLNASRI